MKKNLIFFGILTVLWACQNDYDHNYGINEPIDCSLWEYLQSDHYNFDSIVVAVRHAGLETLFEKADFTFFAITNHSVNQFLFKTVDDMEKQKHQQVLQIFLVVTSLLTLFLACAVWYVIRQVKKLARARQDLLAMNEELKLLNERLIEVNQRQHETNDSLTEANHIKEEYVGRFMGLCSTYIDKLEGYRRMLNKQAASGKVEELYKTLKSSRFIDEELKEFYQNFDNSFLSIFPDFVKRFNELLPEEERIIPKQDERLTTELRIFALIRLGITDSAKIAGFLRYSITTIYTYRSKLKNRSLCRDNFEEEVMKIGSFAG